MTKPAASIPFRRSTRVQVRIPVTLSGTLPDGQPFSEQTYVLSVSKYGGRLQATSPLLVGAEVKISPQHHKQSAQFRVVWVGRVGTTRAGEIGIEYIELSNLLGVNFPV